MPTTLIVEPDPGGHRFQAAANVAAVARRTDDVVLLTSRGATALPAFTEYLGDTPIEAREVFDEIYPPTATMLEAVAAAAREREVSTVVVMDADQSLKRWWYLAPRALRGLKRKPRVVFMLTRYPAKLRLDDRTGWKLRISKGALVAVSMATGSLHRAAGFAGRDDTSTGWLVKRARDLDVCTAHSRDRAAIREGLGLPADRTMAGIFGVISARKHARLIWEALQAGGIEADLLLAGKLDPDVAEWVATTPPTSLGRIIAMDEFLSNEVLDQAVAAVDVVPIALTNNGPSGIMGKALSAEVPVVTAGSTVRAREIVATDGGEVADLDRDSLAAAIRRALDRDPDAPRRNTVPPATAEGFAEALLGVGPA